jgi:hypothetical protein
MATSRSKKWGPIKAAERTNTTTAKKTASTAPISSHKGATFAVGTNFKEREVPTAKKTPAKEVETTAMMKECIARVLVKTLAGAADIQETVMRLLGYCLVILQERNKTACFVNAAKSIEAHKLTDFLRDFTDFHDDWGKWGKPMKSFLNMMPKDKDDHSQALFIFEACGNL